MTQITISQPGVILALTINVPLLYHFNTQADSKLVVATLISILGLLTTFEYLKLISWNSIWSRHQGNTDDLHTMHKALFPPCNQERPWNRNTHSLLLVQSITFALQHRSKLCAPWFCEHNSKMCWILNLSTTIVQVRTRHCSLMCSNNELQFDEK